MREEWNAAETGNRLNFIFSFLSPCSTASMSETGPEKTIWPGLLWLAMMILLLILFSNARALSMSHRAAVMVPGFLAALAISSPLLKQTLKRLSMSSTPAS